MNTIKKIRTQISDVFFQFWPVLFPLAGIMCISIFGQFSVSGGLIDNVFIRHVIKITFSFIIFFVLIMTNRKIWIHYAYILYLFALIALIGVSVIGDTRLGAQRWIDLYIVSIQPSELMKLALIICLGRYFSLLSTNELADIKNYTVPLFMTFIPAFLILKQPDLGTAVLLALVGGTLLYVAGFKMKYVAYCAAAAVPCLPIIWVCLKTYQKNRILTFLNPDRDPLGTGYHILQSKIAIGSGGVFGKGFANGTQVALDFLPEKHTDFIFTSIAEEFGFLCACFIIILFICLLIGLIFAASSSKNAFGKYICIGSAVLIFAHAFINISMVIGLVPVVGVPIPFISYGGSSLITCMSALGISIACTKTQ